MTETRVTLIFDRDHSRWRYVVLRPVYYEGVLDPDPRLPEDWPKGLLWGEDGMTAAKRHDRERDQLRQVAAEQLGAEPSEIGWEEPC